MELSIWKISAFNIPYITYISFTFPLWCNISLLRKILLRGSIFHRTVLEGYWEFGARIGTKMKLAVSTFSSFRLFLFSKTTKLLNFWKRDKISFQNTTLTSRVFREFRMGIGPPSYTSQYGTYAICITADRTILYRTVTVHNLVDIGKVFDVSC